ncbi:MAG: hypothetical protein FWF92_10735 [Oscillospiraceae bacterium]|nr:hypothetical protein [Oscillospiraceae bacterium]
MNEKSKNYNFMFRFSKLLQPVFNVLFYVCIFFIILAFILSVILFFVNVEVEKMLLPPFMHKIINNSGEITEYEISFGNGIKVVTDYKNVVLDDIKAVLYAGIFVLICTFLTVAPVFRFLSLILININSGDPGKMLDEKNPRYIMFIGLCIFLGTVLIRFMMRFYNYYLAARFIKGAPQEIKLSLGIDILDGMTGLAILFIGLICAYIFQCVRQK